MHQVRATDPCATNTVDIILAVVRKVVVLELSQQLAQHRVIDTHNDISYILDICNASNAMQPRHTQNNGTT
jgi:hypothetical protein